MDRAQLENILDRLRNLPAENEIVEFKHAATSFDSRKLGRYFSALANEANLAGKQEAWLVFGIQNDGHKIIGTGFRPNRKKLNGLKSEIAGKTTNNITFTEIYELDTPDGRVIMFQIPPAPRGLPVAFEGHYFGRNDEALSPLNIEEIERIRNQISSPDWSAGIVKNATIDDLDKEAIHKARANYMSKFPGKAMDIASWDDKKFLDKAKITIKGKITRTAIVLLGKEEAETLLSPSEVKIRWLLKDSLGNDRDHLIVSCPMILAVDKIYDRIRNLKYRYIKDGTLFPEEVDQYEPFTIREALNNCIAHQDYTMNARINVIESEDRLTFTNRGEFIPGSVEKVVSDDSPEEHYRNRFLATAMFNINMVDTAGGGIRKMFTNQRERFFPMPEYDLTDRRVKVTIIGKVLDMDYARLLAKNDSLTIEEIILLDKVQKKKSLKKDEIKYLRSKKLIEGRKPNFYISKYVAGKTGQKSDYTKNKAFENKYYTDLIMNSVEQHGSMTRKEINQLIWEKLPDWMNEKQKTHKVNNLIAKLRSMEKIVNVGTYRDSKWVLIK